MNIIKREDIHQLVTEQFINVIKAEPSGWSMRITEQSMGLLTLGLHWTDKADPTHILILPKAGLIRHLRNI